MRGVHKENRRPNPVCHGRTIVKCYRIKKEESKTRAIRNKTASAFWTRSLWKCIVRLATAEGGP